MNRMNFFMQNNGEKEMKRTMLAKSFLVLGALALAWATSLTAVTSAGGGNDLLIPRQPYSDFRQDTTGARSVDFTGVVVKFLDGSGVRADSGSLAYRPALGDGTRLLRHGVHPDDIQLQLREINWMLVEHRLAATPLFTDREDALKQHREQAERYWGQELAELQTFVHLPKSAALDLVSLERLVIRLGAMSVVETAYLDPVPQPLTPTVGIADWVGWGQNPLHSCFGTQPPPGLPDLTGEQGYLWTPPAGMNVKAARSQPGGRGENVRVIDIEWGFYAHGDHPWVNVHAGKPQSAGESARAHGTSSIGVIAAKDNDAGTEGIAPASYVGFRSLVNGSGGEDPIIDHVYWAGKHSLNGVVLIEVHKWMGSGAVGSPECPLNPSICRYRPMEYWPGEHAVIKQAVGNGATVVEAAGNGGWNLDTQGPQFNPDDTLNDSGAILVGGSKDDGVTPIPHFNFGSRVNVHGWGENVATASPPVSQAGLLADAGACWKYRDDYNGTSSASALVAGAVAVLISGHEAKYGFRPDPLWTREYLEATGTPQVFPSVPEGAPVDQFDVWIGPHPDLQRAFDEL